MQVAEKLKHFQQDFGNRIRLPLRRESGHLKSSLEGRQGIYNEQYWFRLFDLMQSDFPLLTAQLSPWVFNQVVEMYLLTFPSTAYTLDCLGASLPQFLENSPLWQESKWIQIAQFEWALQKAFLITEAAALNSHQIETNERYTLQENATVLCCDWDIKTAKEKLGEPLIEGKNYYLIRGAQCTTFVHNLEPEQYQILAGLKSGLSTETLFTQEYWAAYDPQVWGPRFGQWFKQWTEEGLFVVAPSGSNSAESETASLADD